MQRDDAAAHRPKRNAGEAEARIIAAKAPASEIGGSIHQIAIGFRVADHGAADRRNNVERIEIVEPVEAGQGDGGKLQANEPAAGPQHAKRLRQRLLDPRHVADAECHRRGIEAAVTKRRRFGVGFGEGEESAVRPERARSRPTVEHIGD